MSNPGGENVLDRNVRNFIKAYDELAAYRWKTGDPDVMTEDELKKDERLHAAMCEARAKLGEIKC